MSRILQNMAFIVLTLMLSCNSSSPFSYDKEAIPPERASGLVEKKTVYAKKMMVVSANPQATQAGLEILRADGNALDAAIAVQMALNVVEPQSSGIGGGGFLLYFDNAEKKIYVYDGRETAPAGLKPDIFLDESGVPKNYYDALIGGQSVGVPGIVKMLELAHREKGRLPWEKLFSPAIELAKNGFAISPRLHTAILTTPNLNTFESTRSFLFKADGKTPKDTGTILQNAELADTLTRLAEQGSNAFYEGEIAEDVVMAVHLAAKNPGSLTSADLKNYKPVRRDAVCLFYRIYEVCGAPPPTSGSTAVLQILGILENFDLSKIKSDSLEYLHLFTQASKLAYADRDAYIADPDFINVPEKELLDESYLRSRAKLISLVKDMGIAKAGQPVPGVSWASSQSQELPCTTHFSVVDKQGNAVSFTSSIENVFGSTIFVRGFFLNNEMTDFSFLSNVNGAPIANHIQPGKRPRSSMAPMLVFQRDESQNRYLILAIGSPGGARIIDYVARTLIEVLDFKKNVQEAISSPNIVNRNGQTELETKTSFDMFANQLKQRGHDVIISDLNSGLHGIEVTNSGLIGGVDPRREGVGLGE